MSSAPPAGRTRAAEEQDLVTFEADDYGHLTRSRMERSGDRLLFRARPQRPYGTRFVENCARRCHCSRSRPLGSLSRSSWMSRTSTMETSRSSRSATGPGRRSSRNVSSRLVVVVHAPARSDRWSRRPSSCSVKGNAAYRGCVLMRSRSGIRHSPDCLCRRLRSLVRMSTGVHVKNVGLLDHGWSESSSEVPWNTQITMARTSDRVDAGQGRARTSGAHVVRQRDQWTRALV
jgi:hypothetical protein